MQDKSDVCIIGGGVVGMFTALLLARAGKTVCVIDKTFAASSRYNIGEVSPSAGDEILNPLLKLSQKIWTETHGVQEDEAMGVALRGRLEFTLHNGIVPIFQEEVKSENDAGIPTTCLDYDQLKEHLGNINISPDIKAAKYIPEEPVIATKTALIKLKAAVVRAGVKIWGSDEVDAFLFGDGDDAGKITGVRTVMGDECIAEETIITAGVHVGELLKKLDLNMPIRPARCHILHVTPNDKVPSELMTLRSRYGHIYMKTNRHGRMMLTYDGIADSNQATYTISPNVATSMWLQAEAARMLPPLANAQVKEQTTVLLSVTPDYLPCIGRVPKYKNLSVGIGMGGRSFALSGGVAQCLTDIIMQGEAGLDVSVFSPGRFDSGDWKKVRLPSNLVNVSELVPSPPASIKTIEKHIETGQAETHLEMGSGVHQPVKEINVTGDKSVEGLDKEINVAGDKAVEGLDKEINVTGDKTVEGLDKEIVEVEEPAYTVPGAIGFKDSKKKASMSKLGG